MICSLLMKFQYVARFGPIHNKYGCARSKLGLPGEQYVPFKNMLRFHTHCWYGTQLNAHMCQSPSVRQFACSSAKPLSNGPSIFTQLDVAVALESLHRISLLQGKASPLCRAARRDSAKISVSW